MSNRDLRACLVDVPSDKSVGEINFPTEHHGSEDKYIPDENSSDCYDSTENENSNSNSDIQNINSTLKVKVEVTINSKNNYTNVHEPTN